MLISPELASAINEQIGREFGAGNEPRAHPRSSFSRANFGRSPAAP